MIGDETSTKLQVRRRLLRMHLSRESVSSWSVPSAYIGRKVPLHYRCDASITPLEYKRKKRGLVLQMLLSHSRFAPHSANLETLGPSEPSLFISCVGTVVQQVGLEIEIVGDRVKGAPVAISADGDETVPFRRLWTGPLSSKVGWQWSGRFQKSESNNREITLPAA
jgi:hypothetical protein